jgi:hypothetical protein
MGAAGLTPIPLNQGTTVTLNASGGGTATLGPVNGPPIWHVTKVSVKTSRPGLAPVPTFDLYLGSQDQHGYQESSYDGSYDSTDVDLILFKGQQIIGVWTGGQSGDVATLSLYGERRYS